MLQPKIYTRNHLYLRMLVLVIVYWLDTLYCCSIYNKLKLFFFVTARCSRAHSRKCIVYMDYITYTNCAEWCAKLAGNCHLR